MGAADGGRGGGLRRHHAPAGHALHGARAERRRASIARSRRASPRSRSSPRRPRRSAARTSIRASTSRSSRTSRSAIARSRPACASARYLSTAFGCPYEGDVAPEMRRRHSPRGSSSSASFEVAVSDTIGIAHPGQVPRVLDAVLGARAASTRSRCTFTTRAARRSPTCSRRCRSASRRSTRPPADSAAARSRPARRATSRPTISSTCWMDWESKRACRWRRCRTRRRSSARGSIIRCRRATRRRAATTGVGAEFTPP